MKKEQKIWIKGNPGRYDEIVAKLESLGGKGIYSEISNTNNVIWYIYPKTMIIEWAFKNSFESVFVTDNYKEYKLPKIKKG